MELPGIESGPVWQETGI